MTISITDAAVSHIDKCINSRDKTTVGIRLAVKPSCCSGLAYVIEYANEINKEDKCFDTKGIKILVDSKSIVHLDGTELDFVTEGLQSGLKFNNPNVKDSCGCGESFTTH